MLSTRSRVTPTLLLAVVSLLGCGAPPAPTTPTAPPLGIAAPAETAPTAPPAKPTPSGDAASLGQLDFSVTGSDECQRRFREGMLALHSFEYDQAHESFAAASAADPRCGMAAWGDAMAYSHPVWRQRDIPKGRAALARVAGEEALTPKERAYLGAARALYSKENLKEAHAAWLAAAAAMHVEYPDDDEVVLQHALALLAVHGHDPAHVREQMEAGALALGVLQRRPTHPGAAHYAIHAFDSREHAILALPAARLYARIAPAAGHAQHMPSHTFTHLGMWRDVVPSNEHAYAASVAWAKAHGKTQTKYDWHSYSWLVAAHLELGQHARARQLLDEAAALLASATGDSAPMRGGYVDMVSDYVTQTDRWGELEALVTPIFAPAPGEGSEPGGPVACAAHAPGANGDVRAPVALIARWLASGLRAEAAIRLHDERTAVKRVDDMKALRAEMAPWAKMLGPETMAVQDAREDALLARARAGATPSAAAQKKVADALERLDRAQIADGVSGPAWERTPRETLGELLLATGKAKEALAQFERNLEARPNRALALLGAARAAKVAGEAARARAYYATLADLWSNADAALPGLAEVRAGAT